ncbi:helix-turn-helix transcriptional regulator [Amycolatopsis sp. NPDC051071]|uniref:helix-turn-helix transcriptional regulator n=1 Tax=Amycolatopsis sp. NPDC051071 TaxID=3154637 RepID=UPI0034385C25
MSIDSLPDDLRRLGLASREIEVYSAVLDTGPSDLDDVAGLLGHSAEDVRVEVEHLVRQGLLAYSGRDGRELAPVEPNIALQQLAAARSAELQRSHVAALNAYRAYRRSVSQQPTGELLEVVTGASIIDRVWHIEESAESQVLRFDSPPYHTHAVPNPVEVANLERGVDYRVVYSRSAVQNSSYYAGNIRPCIAAGEQARVLPSVPVKLTVYDRRLALVSMSSVEAEVNDSLLLVRPSSLLSALTGLFEASWRAALPMHLDKAVPPALSPVNRRVLELLSTGVSDDTIAELLGISRRTLSRHLEQLTTRAGALTRFQLALHAAREGWI